MTYLDHDHLLDHARRLYPNSKIQITYTDDEIIYIDVNGNRFTFEITSDDEKYVFTGGQTTFTIPLMDCEDDY